MDFNKTVDLIIRDLEEAREIIDDLKNYPGVPSIQIEMAKSKCRNVAEVIALLKNKTEDRRPKIDDRSEEPERSGARRSQIPSSGTEDIGRKPLAASREPVVVSPEPGTASREPVTGIIADNFDNLDGSLNEKLGSLRDDNDVSGFIKTKPLENISQAIGINDRFLFIRELFNGNSESYSQAIVKIDEAKSLTDAKTLMQSYTGDKSESDAGKQLLDLVKRKFPGDE
jgi:hypothetical protein